MIAFAKTGESVSINAKLTETWEDVKAKACKEFDIKPEDGHLTCYRSGENLRVGDFNPWCAEWVLRNV